MVKTPKYGDFMNKFIIATENTCDLPSSLLEELGVKVINLHYYLDGVEYLPGEYNKDDFYKKLRAGQIGSTSQPNAYEFEAFFRSFLDQGYDVLELCFSSVLSGTYNNAVAVSKRISKDYPNQKLLILDTKSQSAGQGLIVYLVSQYAKDGHSIDECYNYAESLIEKVNHVFTIDDLRSLARTGRVSNAEAFFGNLLQIKPALFTSKEGYLTPSLKLFSRKLALRTLCDKVKARYNGLSNKIFITHSDCLEDAEKVKKMLSTIEGVEIEIFDLGPVIGCHTGADTIAIFFTADERKPLYLI